ncbi:hypothetical protein ES708_34846 [subsurface metagenome]
MSHLRLNRRHLNLRINKELLCQGRTGLARQQEPEVREMVAGVVTQGSLDLALAQRLVARKAHVSNKIRES